MTCAYLVPGLCLYWFLCAGGVYREWNGDTLCSGEPWMLHKSNN